MSYVLIHVQTADSILFIRNYTDNTKLCIFNLEDATTSTTTTLNIVQTDNRTITFPDITDTLTSKNSIDNFTNKTITDNSNNVSSNSLKTTGTSVNVSNANPPTIGQVLQATSSTTAVWADIQSPNIYYTYVEDLTLSTTTGTTFVQKLRMTTPSLPAGTYRIACNYNWNTSSTSQDFIGQVQIDDTTTIITHRQEAKDPYTNQSFLAYGFSDNILTAGVHTIDLDFASSSNGTTARIFNAKIELWKNI